MKALQFERKICGWLRNHYFICACIIATALAIVVRYNVLDFISPDTEGYLLPWYDEIAKDGIRSLNHQVGNYGITYQTLIAILTYLPLYPVHGFKICNIICDFGIAIITYKIIKRVTGEKKLGLIGYIIIILHPVVFFNSSVWGQCDAIFTLFCLISLLCFLNEKYTAVFIFFGVAFSFKLQAIFLLPFYIILYVLKNKYSILNFLWIPITMVTLSLGGVVQGRKISDVFELYATQAETYKSVSVNYPSIWNTIIENRTSAHYATVAPFCIIFTIAVLGLWMFYLMRDNQQMSNGELLFVAFLTTYITVFFLPSMHERYSYIYIILGLIVAFIEKRTIPPYICLVLIDCQTYSRYLFDNVSAVPWMVLVSINIISMAWYCYTYVKYHNSNLNRKTKAN